jgi:hypothetical protein
VEREGSLLRVRVGAQVRQYDLDAADTTVTFHPWGLARGAGLRLRAGQDSVVVACDGQVQAELPWAAPLDAGPDLILRKADFEALLASLAPALVERSRPPHDEHDVWLWEHEGRSLPAFLRALRVLGFLLGMALSVRLTPVALGVSLALALLIALVAIEVARARRLAKPSLRLTLADGQLGLGRADSDALLGRWPLAAVETQWARWKLQSRYATTAFDSPAVVIVVPGIADGLPRPLSIGSPCAWAKTGGPRTRTPRFLVSPACWPGFAQALLTKPLAQAPAASAREAPGSSAGRSHRS